MVSSATDTSDPQFSVAVVGAGPRGTSIVERMADLLRRSTRVPVQLQVTIFDPYPGGSGMVWDPGQSPNFWMNTPMSYPTVAPERTGDGPGLSFEQFVTSGGDGAPLTAREAEEISSLGPGSYPTRALYGRYLQHVFQRSVAQLAAHPQVNVAQIQSEVLAVRPELTGYQVEYRHPDSEASATARLSVDCVVLALGHQDSAVNPWQRQLAEAADRNGLTYLPPNIPANVDYAQFPPGEPALIRGLGLNFFDAMAELSLGRGGRFVTDLDVPGHRLRYEPSGEEPRLMVASRRGTPYWGKPVADAFIPEQIQLEYMDAEELMDLVVEARTSGNPNASLSFSRHIWPRLHRDILLAYYSQSARVYEDQLPQGSEAFIAKVREILDAEHHEGVQVWLSQLHEYIDRFPRIGWLDVPLLAHPFDQVGFESHAHYQQAVRDYLVHNAQRSEPGIEDPLSRAIMTMNAGRMIIKELIARNLVDEQSRITEIQGKFEPLVEGLSSGPPLERIEQLLALSRAGLVEFIGPDPQFGFDEITGLFTASSPWVDADEFTAKVLCEAMMPANRVLQNKTPLMRQLLGESVARVHTWTNDDGETVPGSGFEVRGTPYRLVDGQGLAHRGLFVLGLQLSSAQWGTAIAGQAGDLARPGARTLRDAQDIVKGIARLAGIEIPETPTEFDRVDRIGGRV